MTCENCTRAHVQENKSIYLSIYVSLEENVPKNGCIYIYIYIYIYIFEFFVIGPTNNAVHGVCNGGSLEAIVET